MTEMSIHEAALLAATGITGGHNEMAENGVCKGHSGFEGRITRTEDDVKALWAKWDRMQLTLLGIFAALATNLLLTLWKG